MKKIFFSLIISLLLVTPAFGAGIPLGSSFNLTAQVPIDIRTVVLNNTARDAISAGSRYEGLTVYSIASLANYQLQGGITNSDWVELGTGTGGEPLYTAASSTLLRYGTSSDVLTEGTSNLFYTLARVQTALAGGYNAIFGNSTTTNATTTNLYVSGNAKIGSLNGILKATTGLISTATAGVDYVASTSGNWIGTWQGYNAGDFLTSFTESDPLSIHLGTTSVSSITALPNLSIVKSQVSDFGTYEAPLTFSYPLQRVVNAISIAFGTSTSNTWGGTQTFNNIKTSTTSAYAAFDQNGLLVGTNTPTMTESDPVWTADKINYVTHAYASSTFALISDLAGYLSLTAWNASEASKITSASTTYWNDKISVEADPVFTSSFAHSIASSTNWDTAFSWGNWATGIWASSSLATILNNAVTAYSWGNHASAGYLTTETDPLSIHIGTTSVSSIIALPNLSITKSQVSDFGSPIYTETDPIYANASSSLLRYGTSSDALSEGLVNKFYTQARVWSDIWASSTLATILNNAQTAFSWGNHASVGYITATSSETLSNKSGLISQWTNDSGYLTGATGEPLWNAASNTIPYLLRDNVFTGYNTLASTTVGPFLTIEGSEGDYTKMGIKLQDSAYASDGFSQITFIPKTLGESFGLPYNITVIGAADGDGVATTSMFLNQGPIVTTFNNANIMLGTELRALDGITIPIISGSDSDGNDSLFLRNTIAIYDPEDDGGAIAYQNASGEIALLAFAPTVPGEIHPVMTYIGRTDFLGGTKLAATATSTITGFMDTLSIKGKTIGVSDVGAVHGVQFQKNVGTGIFGTGVLTGFLGSVLTNNSLANWASDMVMYTQSTSTQATPHEAQRWSQGTTTIPLELNLKGGLKGNGYYNTTASLDPGVSGVECDDGDTMVGINADLTLKCLDLTY